jgi:hypothetical protein
MTIFVKMLTLQSIGAYLDCNHECVKYIIRDSKPFCPSCRASTEEIYTFLQSLSMHCNICERCYVNSEVASAQCSCIRLCTLVCFAMWSSPESVYLVFNAQQCRLDGLPVSTFKAGVYKELNQDPLVACFTPILLLTFQTNKVPAFVVD